MAVITEPFGLTQAGKEIKLFTITNNKGSILRVTNMGAVWVGMVVRDKNGNMKDVVLGLKSGDRYETASYDAFGGTVGRSANRISHCRFTLNGKEYVLADNDSGCNLHSGPDMYYFRLWDYETTEGELGSSVTFSLVSPDKDQGMPGTLNVSVTYTLTDDNAVEIHYEGISDQDTVANMTNHSYFNLGGHDSGNVYEQTMQLNATTYTPVIDSKSIPTGEIAPVVGTPMDFTQPKAIGKEIDADFEQLQMTGGYDHNFVLDKPEGAFDWMAKAYCEKTGIALEAYTDCPGVQFYAANFVDNEKGKNGAVYDKRHAFCLESQYCPNAVNDTHFAQPFLKAGEKYDTKTVYRFLVK